MPNGADRFSSAMAELHNISKINCVAVEAVMDNYNRHKDSANSLMLTESLALGLRQIAYLRQELLLLTIDQDIAAANQSDSSAVDTASRMN